MRQLLHFILTIFFFIAPFVSYTNAQCTGVNYEALVDIFESTDGENWENRWDLSDCDYCQWYGVVCNDDQLVVELRLRENNLDGSISNSIGNLSELEHLSLAVNDLSGSIPTNFENLINLKSLHLNENRLSREIPIELGNLIALETLNLSGNRLSSTIPKELGDLINLESLSLSNNWLSGAIPVELGNLVNLAHLSLDNNVLNDEIPIELGNLIQLTSLYLHFNQLSGDIPYELGNLTKLRILWLGKNRLTGSIPVSFGNLENLTSIILSTNRLSGCYPAALLNSPFDMCQFDNDFISFENNFESSWEDFCSFSEGACSVPQCSGVDYDALAAIYNSTGGRNWNISWDINDCNYCNWFGVNCDSDQRVIALELPFNRLVGNFPAEIGNLTELLVLNLLSNELRGNIPGNLGNLVGLFSLDLSWNDLTGEIPSEVTQLNKMWILNLQENNLSGCYSKNLLSGPLDMCQFNNYSISDGNNFVSTWEEFCATLEGSCTDLVVLPIQPNPVQNEIRTAFSLNEGMPISYRIFDLSGKTIQKSKQQRFYSKGDHEFYIQTQSLPSGIYFLSLHGLGDQLIFTERFVKL